MRLFYRILFFIVLLKINTSWVFADTNTCGDVDMRAPGGVMESIPVRDQSSYHNCSFVAESAMAEAFMRRERIRQQRAHPQQLLPLETPIDPYVLAMEGSSRGSTDYLTGNGADLGDAIREMKRFGVCSRTALDPYGGGSQRIWYDTIQRMDREDRHIFLETLKTCGQVYSSLPGEEQRLRAEALAQEIRCSPLYSSMDMLPHAMVQTLAQLRTRDVDQALRSCNGRYSFLRQIMFPECFPDAPNPNRRAVDQVPNPRIETIEAGATREQMLQRIRTELSQTDPIPVEVNMNLNGLSGAVDCNNGGCNHAMLVIGSRSDTSGKCWYLLRNSWGVSCEGWNVENSEGVAPASGKPRSSTNLARLDAVSCDGNGNLWIQESSMLRHLDGIASLPLRP